MKNIIIILLFIAQSSFGQTSFFDLKVDLPDSIDMRELKVFSGKKTLVAIGSFSYLQKAGLIFLDSLNKENPTINMLVFPADDLDASLPERAQDTLAKKGSRNFLIASFSSVKKGKQMHQPVIDFLTDIKQNGHTDEDIKGNMQLYIVNESGELIAVLYEGFSKKTLRDLLSQ